eukprot:CAMPEP_0170634074 /NCGR_PEP_ID=MMETSP0224-20130122/36375_1 /TAXON_ID=285029 /ORGANISM="Togula jolla, Strain CCCM 725" /LENGTH=162 /DNA_ID=CAMNT_0010963245 /DNA_START=6 /DNA_END=490 /DNA_ORIENTATION=+
MKYHLYGLLGVRRDADDAVIRSAYRRRALATHPDKKNGSAAEFLEVVDAFEVLSDPLRRGAYDQELLMVGATDGQVPGVGQDPRPPKAAEEGPGGIAATGVSLARSAPTGEGTAAAEEARAQKMWRELLGLPPEARQKKVDELSCRSAEVLLSFAKSFACRG